MSFKKAKIKVSIVMTAYNGEKYISEQIESILSQSYQNWELIICDDSSKDSTFQIAQKYAKKDSRIKAKQNIINLGLAKNFESGLSFCTGEYIAVCDMDDFWVPTKLEEQVRYLNENLDIGLVYHDLFIVDENLSITNDSMRKKQKGKLYSLHRIKVEDDSLRALVQENHITSTSIMFRKELLRYILPIPDKISQDYWISLIAATFSQIGYVEMQLAKYRQHHTNMAGANVQGYNFYLSNLFKKEFKSVYRKETEAHLIALNSLLLLTSDLLQQKKFISERIYIIESLSQVMNSDDFTTFINSIIKSVIVINKSKQLYNYKLLVYLIIYKVNFTKELIFRFSQILFLLKSKKPFFLEPLSNNP